MPARAWKTLAVLTALAVCVGAITYAVLWLAPPKAPRLLVAVADYADNPLVPPNADTATAAQGLIDLNRFTGRGRLRPDNAPNRLTHGEAGNLLTKLSALREPVVVAVFAANGGCDKEGPFLIPDDASPEPGERIRVRAILDAVAKLPPDTRKLIVFDAAGNTSAPVFGQFHNDFFRGVQRLDADIAAIPNLLVFVSAGADQRSWRSPEWGESAFLHHLRTGLAGGADANGDNRLSADELVEYATRRTRQWASDHRGALQVPALFPTADGHRRAAGTMLGVVEKHADAEPEPAKFEPGDNWQRAWDQFKTFDTATPHPATYSPLRWRQYTEWLLRADRLFADGDEAGAANALARASQHVPLIEADRAIAVSPQTLTLPSALDQPSAPSDKFGPVIGKVALASEADRTAEWERAKKEGDRLALGRALVRWVAEDPFARLKLAPPVVALIAEGFNVVPAELHFLTMVARDLPPHPASAAVWPLLQRVLRLRLTAEETATGAQGEAVHPWIAGRVAAADESRRVAEDLLFSDAPAGWFVASTCATFAEWLYADAAATADVIRTARVTWQTAIPRLNGLTEWLAAGEHPKDLSGRMSREDLLNTVRATWADVHRLAEWSEGVPSTDRVAHLKTLAKSVADRVAEVEALHHRITGTEEELRRTEVARLLGTHPSDESRAELVVWWRDADTVLSVPFADRRRELLVELRRVSRQLHKLAQSRSDSLAEPTADEVRERAFDAARRRGLLHLSTLGRAAFEPMADIEFSRTAFQLDQFSRQADAPAELIAGEDRFAAAVRRLPGLIPADDTSLPLADRLARLSLVTPQSDPAVRLRKLRAADLLNWQADRTQADRWSGGDSAKPYYRHAADVVREDARKLVPVPAVPTPATGFPLTLPDLPDLTVTDELNPRAVFAVKSAGTSANGVVVYRGAEATFSRATAGPLAPVELAVRPRSGPPPTTPAVERSVLTLRGYFRGETVEARVNVARHPLPHATAVRRTAKDEVSVAVRTTDELRNSLGTGSGHLHFVIDCSGSMGTPDNPAERPEFAKACDRLEEVLRAVPNGVTVAVSAFGQRTPAAKTPEDTFATLREPTEWAGTADELEGVMKRVRALQPWDKSAVVRSVLQARKAIGDISGPRAVILFSDCADNRFTDPELNPKRVAVKDVLRAAFGDGCPLHVVAFPAEKAAEAVREEFRSLTTFKPAGLFLVPDKRTDKHDTGPLTNWIHTATAPQVKLKVVTDRDSADLAAGTAAADNWLSPLPKAGRGEIRLLAPVMSRPVELQAGERLLIGLTGTANALRFTRPNFAASVPAVQRVKEGEWAVAVPRQRLTDSGGLELVALADRDPKFGAKVLTPARVGDVWFELNPATRSAVAVKWTNTTGWPCPAWAVETPAWPTDSGKAAVPAISAWWSEWPFAAAGSWAAPSDKPLSAAAPFAVSTTAGEVTVNGLSVETHDGRTCLAVRLTHPVGKTVIPRVKASTPDGKDTAPEGSEVRVYRDASRVTALFWWADPADMKAVRGLEFVAVEEAKKQAAEGRTFAALPPLPPPAVGTPAPTPAPR